MQNTKILVSVIIPVYNSEKTIEQCIKSILEQIYKNIEILVIDDGSTDNTSQIVEKIKEKDKRVKLIYKKNGGVSSARNLGIERSSGKFLTFVDADDEILPNMIQRMLDIQKFYNADLVKVTMIRILNSKKQYNLATKEVKKYFSKLEWQNNFFDILKNELNSPVGKLYKKDILVKYKIFFNKNLDIAEDLHFNLNYLENSNIVIFLPELYYKYYLFNSYLTTKYRSNLFSNRELSIDLFNSFLERNKISKNIVYYLYIKLIFSDAINEIQHRTNKKERISKIQSNLKNLKVQKALKNYKPEGIISRILYILCKIQKAEVVDLFCKIIILLKNNKYLMSARKISV